MILSLIHKGKNSPGRPRVPNTRGFGFARAGVEGYQGRSPWLGSLACHDLVSS
jgi:hypothetical protein